MATTEQIAAFIADDFPQAKCTIQAVGDAGATVVQEIGAGELRPGGTVSREPDPDRIHRFLGRARRGPRHSVETVRRSIATREPRLRRNDQAAPHQSFRLREPPAIAAHRRRLASTGGSARTRAVGEAVAPVFEGCEGTAVASMPCVHPIRLHRTGQAGGEREQLRADPTGIAAARAPDRPAELRRHRQPASPLHPSRQPCLLPTRERRTTGGRSAGSIAQSIPTIDVYVTASPRGPDLARPHAPPRERRTPCRY